MFPSMNIVRKGDILDLDVEKMAYGGRGLVRADNFVIFVQGAFPGDRVRAVITRKKQGFAEARLQALLSPSPDRVEVRCSHSPYCGGCQWQELRYETQLFYKRNFVRESLSHIGGLEGVPVRSVLPSPRMFQYRNKMEFSFSDRRWLLPEELDQEQVDDAFALGLHVSGSYRKVLAIDVCHLQEQLGNEILRCVRDFARSSEAPVYGITSHEGFWRFLTLRHSVFHDQWMVNVVTAEDRPRLMELLTGELTRRFPSIKTVVNNISRKKASIAVGERERCFFGDGFLEDRIGRFHFRISANSFFQTNSRAAHLLYDQVVKYAEPKAGDRVLDLYSGTGTIPLYLSDHVEQVVGMEITESAVRDAERNAGDNGVKNCRFVCGDIRKMLGSFDYRPHVVIVDPPRAGMHSDVLARLRELAPERIVYVSCNPATLARDLECLVRDYRIQEIQPVDLFPHTYHIEAVAGLVRKG
jgi:23S rRNA (uracil1939-C5)-methyltransferase